MSLDEWKARLEDEARALGMRFDHYVRTRFYFSDLCRQFIDSCLKLPEPDAFRAAVELTREDLRDD